MRFLFLLLLPFLHCSPLNSQTAINDSVHQALTINAYGEFYYSYDFSRPLNGEKSNFIYNHKRHNEITANLIYVKANYKKQNYRANLGAMVGTYAEYNLASEPTWAQFIYEANAGMKLSQKYNLWFDIGIMPSHLGFESAVGDDCWTLTRSLLAEGSPYYEAGAKLSYTSKNEKFYSSILVLNGWQRIRRLQNSSPLPALGFQFQYKPKDGWILNYGNFIGNAQPDSLNALRHFHNFYIQYESQKKWGLILGFDLGMDKYNPTDYGLWYSPVAILRYKWTPKWTTAARLEYYFDQHGIIFPTSTSNGFQTFGASLNQDFQINSSIKLRLEYKYLQSKDAIFSNQNEANHSVTSACIFTFQK
jgi:hypothetical protein